MTPPLPKPKKKRGGDGKKAGRGAPFPKGVSGNPGGRPRKPPPDVHAVLLAGNMTQLENLWKLTFSSNERIRLAAIQTWLRKTIPDTDMLIVPGAGKTGPTNVNDAREAFRDRLAKLFGLGNTGPVVDAVPAFPRPGGGGGGGSADDEERPALEGGTAGGSPAGSDAAEADEGAAGAAVVDVDAADRRAE